jgi:hypothetical protein
MQGSCYRKWRICKALAPFKIGNVYDTEIYLLTTRNNSPLNTNRKSESLNNELSEANIR